MLGVSGGGGGQIVAGVKDFDDDGDQRFDVLVGPCRSTDRRFDRLCENLSRD